MNEDVCVSIMFKIRMFSQILNVNINFKNELFSKWNKYMSLVTNKSLA